MTGLLCGALIVSNVISTGIQISATEMGSEQTYMDNSQNVVGIIDEADNAPSNNGVGNGNFQVDGLEDENEDETTPEELKFESQEQEETENEESEGDSVKFETNR